MNHEPSLLSYHLPVETVISSFVVVSYSYSRKTEKSIVAGLRRRSHSHQWTCLISVGAVYEYPAVCFLDESAGQIQLAKTRVVPWYYWHRFTSYHHRTVYQWHSLKSDLCPSERTQGSPCWSLGWQVLIASIECPWETMAYLWSWVHLPDRCYWCFATERNWRCDVCLKAHSPSLAHR